MRAAPATRPAIGSLGPSHKRQRRPVDTSATHNIYRSGRIVVVGHARKRGRQRNITRRQIERCCQLGTITEGPFWNVHGNWQVTLYRHAAGEEVTCAVAIEWATHLIVITAF